MKTGALIAAVLLPSVFTCGCSLVSDEAVGVVQDTVDSATSRLSEVDVEEYTSRVNSEIDKVLDKVIEESEALSSAVKTSEQDNGGGILTSAADIELTDVDGTGKNYIFYYDGDEYSAVYTTDNWKIRDSYRINSSSDMEIICQALIEEHPVHGADMVSYRTADDMAYEWLQHNLAYQFLSDDSSWKAKAKDVDLNPADQGLSFDQIYERQTGQEFSIDNILGGH